MIKRNTPTALLVIVLIVGAGLLISYVHGDPSTAAIDADLEFVRTELKSVNDESARYDGGLIKVMVELRKQFLETTRDMLELKRTSLLRRINLNYDVSGIASQPNADDLKRIEQDIEGAKLKLHGDQAETQRYSGGLAQSMALMAAAVDRLALSQLYMAYYGKKYGIPYPDASILNKSEGQPHPLGTPAKDKDAL